MTGDPTNAVRSSHARGRGNNMRSADERGAGERGAGEMMKGIPLSSRFVRVVVLAIKRPGPNCPSSSLSSVRSHQRASRSPVSCSSVSSWRLVACLSSVYRFRNPPPSSRRASCRFVSWGVSFYSPSAFVSAPSPSRSFSCFVGEGMRTPMGVMDRRDRGERRDMSRKGTSEQQNGTALHIHPSP